LKVEITSERVNRLLHRTEVHCRIMDYNVTPTRQELAKEIASKKHVDENLVVVDSIKQKYGCRESTSYVKIYESEKAVKKVEGEKKKKETPETPAPAAPAQTQAPATENEKPGEETTGKPALEQQQEEPEKEKPARTKEREKPGGEEKEK